MNKEITEWLYKAIPAAHSVITHEEMLKKDEAKNDQYGIKYCKEKIAAGEKDFYEALEKINELSKINNHGKN